MSVAMKRWLGVGRVLRESGLPGLAWELFKRRHRLDLSYVSTEQLGYHERQGHHYSDSGGPFLQRVLADLQIGPADSILDLGCGKGGALITMSRFPFARVEGVDLSPALLATAHSNLTRLGLHSVRLHQADASEFEHLDGFSHLYLYNPFPEPIVEGVVDHLCRSLARRPRPFVLIYKNPVADAAIRRHFPHAQIREWLFGNAEHHRIRAYRL